MNTLQKNAFKLDENLKSSKKNLIPPFMSKTAIVI